jgi:hypothetical protein
VLLARDPLLWDDAARSPVPAIDPRIVVDPGVILIVGNDSWFLSSAAAWDNDLSLFLLLLLSTLLLLFLFLLLLLAGLLLSGLFLGCGATRAGFGTLTLNCSTA